jgi:acetoin utilization deacetylase AcuC-like enzyme
MLIVTDERCTGYSAAGHPERPARISGTLEKLREQKEIPITWLRPSEVQDESILRAHTREHLKLVRNPPGDFDGDTPAYPNIADHALRSVGGALEAMQQARKGSHAFSLLRPPGHHATKNQAMGFCFLNSIAIALLEGQALGSKRVAVYDFDVHHGNGTEDILLDRPGTVFYSVHQHPCYPGTGTSDRGNNCFNFPVAPKTPRAEYRKVLKKALDGLTKFKPDLIAVSAGFDAYARDPLAQETLEPEDYHWLGQSLRDIGIPFFSVLEGGYSTSLPDLVLSYLKGAAGS